MQQGVGMFVESVENPDGSEKEKITKILRVSVNPKTGERTEEMVEIPR
jgi:hypothetical protein